jgi:translocation and assembly module TamB
MNAPARIAGGRLGLAWLLANACESDGGIYPGASDMRKRTQLDDLDRTPKRKRRLRKLHVVALAALGGALLLMLLLPQIVTQRAILVPLVNRFAGIEPLYVDLAEVRAGWLAPVSIRGIAISDADGHTIAKVASVDTTKGILGWATNYQDLGLIRIVGVEAAIETGGGTSSLEQIIEPLMGEPTASDSGFTPTGQIEIVDSRFLLTERGRPEKWVMQLPTLSVTLPTKGQIVGPVDLQATLGEASGVVADSVGSIAARIEQVGDAFDIAAEVVHLPVEVLHVVRARFPDLPIESLEGRISGKLVGKFADAEQWNVAIEEFTAQQLVVYAPAILGPDPAKIDSLATTMAAQLDGSWLVINNALVACDFGDVRAQALLPWPISPPSVMNPFIDGATCQVEGNVDLPKLIKAAASLIPVRDETQLYSGAVRFSLAQTLDSLQAPEARISLTVSGLRGMAAGQSLEWKEPLASELGASRPASGLQLSAAATAEFAHLQAHGTVAQGQLAGDINLAQLHQKISQWVALPIEDMRGSANVDLAWRTVADSQVVVDGQLMTTNLDLVTNVGGIIHEPAWNGKLSGLARLTDGSPSHLERLKLELLANSEQLVFDLQEPLAIATTESAIPAPRAAFNLTLVGDIASWKRRAVVWLAEPPEVEVGGNISLAVGGRLSTQGLEIEQASWRAKPFSVTTSQYGLSEAELVGGFKGRVDTSDITRLQVESLQVQSTSFTLGARDSASEDGQSRIGRAKFRVNLSQLLTNIGAAGEPQVLPPGAPAANQASQITATGQVEGDLAWNINSSAASLQLVADGSDIAILSQPPGAIAASPLWKEAALATQLTANWEIESGQLIVPSLRLRTDWCDYTGTLHYFPADPVNSKIVSKGQAVVETSKLSTKLAPMTSNQVQLVGTQTFPVDVVWTSSQDPNASALVGLQANTRIGWQSARVVGVQVGPADVPVTVDRGQLSTRAEIPVSGGMLRWNVTSDLTANELVLVQQPMTVLENVAITQEMTKTWLKYVTPLVAEATTVDGRLSLALNQANLIPTNPRKQTVVGRLVMHSAEVGPGPLSNQVIGFVRQIDAIRRRDFTQPVGNQTVWLKMPEQAVDFQMVDGRVTHRNLNVRIGDVTLATSGSVDVSGQMDLVGSMPIPDDWIEKSPWLASLRGQSVQVPVRGSLTSPQLDSSIVQQLGRQAAQGAAQTAAQGLLERGFSRGFERLFGPQSGTSGPPAQP